MEGSTRYPVKLVPFNIAVYHLIVILAASSYPTLRWIFLVFAIVMECAYLFSLAWNGDYIATGCIFVSLSIIQYTTFMTNNIFISLLILVGEMLLDKLIDMDELVSTVEVALYYLNQRLQPKEDALTRIKKTQDEIEEL